MKNRQKQDVKIVQNIENEQKKWKKAKLGGGGTPQQGAAKFEKTTISKVEQDVKKIIKEMGE